MRIPAALLFSLVLASVTVASQASLPGASASDVVALRVIVVDTDVEARRVVDEIAAGTSFAALARAVSVDPSAAGGGLLGRVALHTLRPEVRAAVEHVRVGQISPIVPVPTGFAILAVVEDADAGDTAVRPPGPALAAAGSVKYVIDVSGFGETNASLGLAPKPPGWNEDPSVICQTRRSAVEKTEAEFERALGPGGLDRRTIRPLDLAQVHFVFGQLHAYHGRMAQAIEQFALALDVASASVPDVVWHLEEALGIAHLHKAHMEHGSLHAHGPWCLLLHAGARPIGPTHDVRKAIGHFAKVLAARPDDLEVRWLLNIAHMAAGTYPDGVPAALLVPPSAFESAEDVGLFVDVAPAAGLVSIAMAGGVIVDDFDNDGRFDVVTSSLDGCQPLGYFRRTADGLFADESASAGLSAQLGGLNILQADYDNDGCLDILVLRGGWEIAQRKSLLRNTCRGTFVEVTREAGLATPVTSTQAAVWADVDNDGRLDLFVGNEGSPAQLFVQKTAGRFEDVAASAGVNRTAFSKGVAAADYDNDGWVDLYVSNVGGTGNFLYRNNRDGTFTEVGQSAGVPGPGLAFATWFFDYDNDGRDDLFVTSYFTSVEETARTYLRQPLNANPMTLYRNVGHGRFEDVTRAAGLEKALMPMGANFGDIDNDGFLDMYLGTGNPSYGSIVPSVLLRNQEGRTFTDVTRSSGTGELHKGHGVAFADLDGDGDQEIVFQVGGATLGDRHALRLFENPGHGAGWLAVKLVGRTSNRSAIGARITVTVERHTGERRSIHRTVGSGGSFGASPLLQHIGLGRDVRRVDVDVWWPASDTRQHFSDVGPNQTIQITELDRDYTTRAPAPLPLGPPARHFSSE